METTVNIEARIKDKELKIIPPEGYEVDKENSTFDCIKFKPIVKKWRDNEKKITNGYWIGCESKIYYENLAANCKENYNIFATEKQAKSALAMARISQIMANDVRFGGIITDKEWENLNMDKFVIYRQGNKIQTISVPISYHFLAFHTAEQRNLFLEENKDLVKDYLMLD